MGCLKSCCSCFTNIVLGFSAFIYLLLGIAITGVAISTFFTPYGQIITPIIAGSGIGGGVAIILIAIIGFCAACNKESTCLLSVFTILTFVVVLLLVVAIVLFFSYEELLHEAARVDKEDAFVAASAVVSTTGTSIVAELSKVTFTACNASVTPSSEAGIYNFACRDNDFYQLSQILNNTCLSDNPINASAGALFTRCYSDAPGTIFSSWPPMYNLTVGSAASTLMVLNTAKGILCACSSSILEEYIMPYLLTVKIIGICITVFFALSFVSCCYQLCKRCCCEKPPEAAAPPHARGWSVGGNVQMTAQGKSGKGRKQPDSVYIARP